MDRQPVAGSTITSVGYARANAILEIEFTSGDVYEYFMVPPSVHHALVTAASPGRFFTDHVRDRYRFRKT